MGIIDKALASATSINGLGINLLNSNASNDPVGTAITWVGAFAGLLAFFYLVYGGFMYITAAGNAEQSKKGGQAIINAVLGLIIIALAWGLVSWLAGTLLK